MNIIREKSFILTAATLLSLAAIGPRRAHAKDADYKNVSLGARAANFNPKDGDDVWYGGAQLRFYPGRVFGLEGSVDYRRETFGSTKVHVYPVQASLLAYLIPGSYVNPFVLA